MIVAAIVAFKVFFKRCTANTFRYHLFFYGEVVSEKAMRELDDFKVSYIVFFLFRALVVIIVRPLFFLFERCTSTVLM